LSNELTFENFYLQRLQWKCESEKLEEERVDENSEKSALEHFFEYTIELRADF